MATLPNTRLETHPDGTTGAAGIVNGNWERLELLFNPAMGSSDPSYNAPLKMLMRSATLPATNGASLQWDTSATRMVARPGVATGSGTAPAVDFKGALMLDYTLTGDATFTVTNQGSGWKVDVLVRAGGSLRNLTFPAWNWVGSAAPASLASGKVAILELRAFGNTAADVVARWTVQP